MGPGMMAKDPDVAWACSMVPSPTGAQSICLVHCSKVAITLGSKNGAKDYPPGPAPSGASFVHTCADRHPFSHANHLQDHNRLVYPASEIRS
jgi:hypothetical protein